MSRVFFHDGTTYDPTFAAATRGIREEEAHYQKRYEEKHTVYDNRTRTERTTIFRVDEFGRRSIEVVVKRMPKYK